MNRKILSILGLAVTSLWAHESLSPSIYPVEENSVVLEREDVRAVDLTGYRNFIGNANVTKDVAKLQSRPGMPFVIYLTFDESRNPSEELKRTIWEQISDDWIMFKANVTTDRDIFDATPLNQRAKCTFKDYFANGGGSKDEATGEIFAYTNLKMDHAPESGGDFLFRTPSHEIAHSFDLVHDICTSPWSNYYSGHGEWSTIMGSSNSRAVSHWSKGEYKGAGNSQDDIAVIGDVLGFVEDDKPGITGLDIASDGTVDPLKNNGTITAQEDTDEFTFEVKDKATVNITGNPSILFPNLDMGLTLKDSDGNILANDEPVGKRTATISTTITTPGRYTIVVDGVSELDPSTGWSDYSSMGYYQLEGIIDGGVTSVVAKNGVASSLSVKYNSKNHIISFDGVKNYNSILLVNVRGAIVKAYGKVKQLHVGSETPGNYILVFKNGKDMVTSKKIAIR